MEWLKPEWQIFDPRKVTFFFIKLPVNKPADIYDVKYREQRYNDNCVTTQVGSKKV